MAVVLKLGLFPFYMWVPAVASFLSWPALVFTFTVQKVLPFYFFGSLFGPLLFVPLFLSIFVAGAHGIREVRFKGVMSYSSVGHSAWLGMGAQDLALLVFLWGAYTICFVPFIWGPSLLSLYLVRGVPPSPLFLSKALVSAHLWHFGFRPVVPISLMVVSVAIYMRFFVLKLCVV